jgi:hypothetical protein
MTRYPGWRTMTAAQRYNAKAEAIFAEAERLKKQITAEGSPDWYARRNELEPEMVFRDYAGDLLKLDHRKPGDGTQWVVAVWHNGWSYCESVIEPGDLRGEPLPDPALSS